MTCKTTKCYNKKHLRTRLILVRYDSDPTRINLGNYMPSKNTIKTYIENGYYHVYNRGVDKRRIFEESQDYTKFLNYLNLYLSPIDALRNENPLLRSNFVHNNLSEKVDLLAFCLMPNHFHLLVKQKSVDGLTKLMRQITTVYSMYFNKKYERVGPLFQGIYKACLVDKDEYLLHLSRYIHQNPAQRGVSLADFPWSSYPSYIGQNMYPLWLKPQEILAYFSDSNPTLSYESFAESETNNPSLISHLTLEG